MHPETKRGIFLGLRLALAHHPLCDLFRSDVFGRRRPLCQGCVLTWPLFLVTLPFAFLAPSWGAPPSMLVAAGLVGGVPQVATVLWRGPRAFRVAAKVVGGPALASLLSGLFWLPVLWQAKAAALVFLFLGTTLLLALRMRSILRTCHACPWQRDWAHCPGLA